MARAYHAKKTGLADPTREIGFSRDKLKGNAHGIFAHLDRFSQVSPSVHLAFNSENEARNCKVVDNKTHLNNAITAREHDLGPSQL